MTQGIEDKVVPSPERAADWEKPPRIIFAADCPTRILYLRCRCAA